jgi:hypothetical protein
LLSDIHTGRWDLVLSQVSSLQLPKDKLMNLYEQIVLELLEAREMDLANEVQWLPPSFSSSSSDLATASANN